MACSDYPDGELWRALGEYAFRDAVLCGYQNQISMVVFATILVLGVVNVPIYIRQDSALVPAILTLVLGGVFVVELVPMAQAMVVFVLLMIFGLGPVLVLRRIQA